MIRSIFIFIYFLVFNLAFPQESRKDTLYILTDFAKSEKLYFDKVSNIKIEVREEENISQISPSGRSYTTNIPAIKVKPKNKILNDLLLKRELANFSIGVQKNICFSNERFQKKGCTGIQDIMFIHRDVDYNYLEDFNAYLDVKDSVEKRREIILLPFKSPRNTYGKIIKSLENIKTQYSYTNLSEFTKKTFFFDYNGLIELVKLYKTIYIESERVNSDLIIFEKVDYEYYMDDM